MKSLQKFCDGVSQPLSYEHAFDSIITISDAPLNNAISVLGSQGCGKQITRINRSFNQSPYCCPDSFQQSRLLYNLLSNCSDQMNCMPVIEQRPIGHQNVWDGTIVDTSNTSQLLYPLYKLNFKGQLVLDTNRDLPMPYFRQRSLSMGSNGWNIYDVSQTSSHDSLASFDSLSNETGHNHSPNQSEVLLEVTRKKLTNLLMGANDDQDSPTSGSPVNHHDVDMKSLSQPGSPLNLGLQEVCRKYSEGSQRAHLKAKLQNARARYDHLPVDLSCKHKRYIQRVTKQSPIKGIEAEILPDEGIDESVDHSILKSVLTGQMRSNSLSVLKLRQLWVTNYPDGDATRNGDAVGPIAGIQRMTGRTNSRQRVTLAKKNLLPVIARIADRLSKIVEFTASLPEFTRLSLNDQKTLLINAYPRLLLLYMAETNLQFAVTVIPDDAASARTSVSGPSLGSSVQQDWETPTMQFVDCVQNFIRKCQITGVSANEYFYMRLITLFHRGTGMLEQLDLIEIVYSEARQDLQDLVQHSHPNEKLRYSALLLSLHTLFGIHCGMLHGLFCRHLEKYDGIEAFVCEALLTSVGTLQSVH